MQSSEALMAAYQRGDLQAFAELLARHEKPLWNFLRRLVGDPSTAEDLLQETFIRVVQDAPNYRPTARFSTWLYTIARNLCVDHARKRFHRRALSLEAIPTAHDTDAPGPLGAVLAGEAKGGEQRALDRELATQLDRAIAELPEPQREVFVMREVLELPFAEIALAVGASEPTVKSRMRYALEKLRETLAPLHDATPHAEELG